MKVPPMVLSAHDRVYDGSPSELSAPEAVRLVEDAFRDGHAAGFAAALAMLAQDGSDLADTVARETRRNRFIRTRRSSFDETVPPTENEIDDARAALGAAASALADIAEDTTNV